MPISFPSSPTTGQTYTYNNKTWTYNGTTWDANTTASIATAVAPITYNASTQAVGLTRTFNTTSATDKGLVIKGSTSQTADLLQLQNSSGTVLGNVAADGSASFTNNNAAGKNLLINGDFGVWQRGTSFTNPTGYTADRWWAVNNTGVIQQSTDAPAGFLYSLYNTTASSFSVGQPIELPATGAAVVAPGTSVTLSFYAKAASSTTVSPLVYYRNSKFDGTNQSSFTNSGTAITIGTSWARYTYTYVASTPNSTNTILAFEVNNLPAGARITGIQLEVGSVATPFTRAGGTIAGELAACQRYYFRETSAGSYWQFGMGNSENTAQAKIIINLPVPMRITPSAVESTTVSNYTCVNTSFTTTTSIAIDGQYCTNRQMVLIIGGTFTAGLPQRFVANNNSTAYIGFSAEL